MVPSKPLCECGHEQTFHVYWDDDDHGQCTVTFCPCATWRPRAAQEADERSESTPRAGGACRAPELAAERYQADEGAERTSTPSTSERDAAPPLTSPVVVSFLGGRAVRLVDELRDVFLRGLRAAREDTWSLGEGAMGEGVRGTPRTDRAIDEHVRVRAELSKVIRQLDGSARRPRPPEEPGDVLPLDWPAIGSPLWLRVRRLEADVAGDVGAERATALGDQVCAIVAEALFAAARGLDVDAETMTAAVAGYAGPPLPPRRGGQGAPAMAVAPEGEGAPCAR